ncbi:thioredoxin family protein [Novosphingobium terrae]|uniref:thioredoxin family protein n=1 Tax=Novosphingobium terrae TaxID=2726189 RepID=UPI00197E7274|nr:thioredoxin family protein [Novosphingobium terrae]
MRLFLAAAIALTCTAAPALAAPAPHVAISSFDQLNQPLPLPYDENADAKADVAKATARAKKEHKLLLLDFGGNWCPDCRVLAGTIELPEVKAFVEKHYVEVTIDVGRYTKNLDIWAGYGQPPRPKGVPAVLIIDPRTRKVLNPGHETALSDARHMSPQALADWLASWTK